jgi:transposase
MGSPSEQRSFYPTAAQVSNRQSQQRRSQLLTRAARFHVGVRRILAIAGREERFTRSVSSDYRYIACLSPAGHHRRKQRNGMPLRLTLQSGVFAQLGGCLEYKARRSGVPLVYVDPA